MPKIKKPRTAAALTAQTVRHEPLGQTIQNDENRLKYASSRKSSRRRARLDGEAEETLLDEKTSERILKLSKEQRLEMEVEERREARKNNTAQNNKIALDSDEEDEEEEQQILTDEQE